MQERSIAKLIDSTDRIVDEMIEGFVSAHSMLVRVEAERIILRKQAKAHGLVGLVIGNGSGHEPANIGFVGYGALDANVCGGFFSAPSGMSLARGARLADQGAGLVLLVANHAGDVLNAEIAKRALSKDGVEVAAVLLHDDISTAPKGSEEMRRSRAGALFAIKIAGALAEEEGRSLSDVAGIAERFAHQTRTLEVTLRPYSRLETGKPRKSPTRRSAFIRPT